MKIVLSLAMLIGSAAWADEAADRTAIEKTISALNTWPSSPELFTTDFPNAAELQRIREEPAPILRVVISREPMGEATWYSTPGIPARFTTRSVTFVAPDTAVVVAVYGRGNVPVLFVLKNVIKSQGTDWRIASFRVISEAQTKVL